MKKTYVVIFIILILPILVSSIHAQKLDIGVHIGELEDIDESKYRASGVSIVRDSQGELISVVKVNASRYLDNPIVDKFLIEAPTSSLIKKGTLEDQTISHYRVVAEYTNPICSETIFEIPGFYNECEWYQSVFGTSFMLEDEKIIHTVFRGLNHVFIVKSGYDVTTYWDIFTRD